MYPTSDFYQLSGYRAHSNKWFKKFDEKPLIKAIMAMKSKLFRPGGEDSPIELVLGILPSGASYLLLSAEQMHTFTHKHRLEIPRDPWRTSDFRSLSPIYFNSTDELTAKVGMYKQRPRNKNRGEDERLDNSKANRGYVQPGSDSGIAHYRDYFEQQRTLYRLLTRELDPGKVGLVTPSWLRGVRVVALVLVEWAVDNRRKADRLNDPRLVDVGWTDAHFPTFFERLTGSTTVHLKLKSETVMKNPGSKNPYFSEIVEDDGVGLYQRLRHLFNHDANENGVPLIVLVHDEDMAVRLLSRAGINVDSWSFGLSHLLPIVPSKVEQHTPTTGLPGPCIVDMQKLVKAVMRTSPGHTVPLSANVLHMQTDTKPCAGDDSLLLLRMWTSMAQGVAIDEQHDERTAHEPECAHVLAPPAAQMTHAAVDPNDVDDVDPNDVDPNDIPPGPRPTKDDDFTDDDDW